MDYRQIKAAIMQLTLTILEKSSRINGPVFKRENKGGHIGHLLKSRTEEESKHVYCKKDSILLQDNIPVFTSFSAHLFPNGLFTACNSSFN